MHECTRQAIDVAGNRFCLIERHRSGVEETKGTAMNVGDRTMFCPDGELLIDEGDNFFRDRFGVVYKLVD